MWLARALVVGALVSVGTRAEATTASVEYTALEGCPSVEDFWRAFSDRARRTQRAGDGDWKLRVRIVGEPGHFEGAVEIGHGGETTTRQVNDSSCKDVTTALAVIAAITVEPDDSPPASVTQTPSVSEPPPTPPPPRPPPVWHLRSGGDFTTATYLAPTASLGGQYFVEVAREGPSPLSPWARLALHYANSGEIHLWPGPATAIVTSWLARFELGLLRLRLVRGLDLGAALMGEAGLLIGQGYGVASAARASAPFVDLGGLARLRWAPSFFFIEVALGLLFVPTHVGFNFEPGPVVLFEVPYVGGVGEVGLGVRFF